METFLGEPNNEEIKEYVRTLQTRDILCIRTYYSPDPLVFSYVISKYIKNKTLITFKSSCDVELKQDSKGKWIIDNTIKKHYYLGNNAFSSYLIINNDDILSILTGVISSTIIERRRLSEWELSVIKSLEQFGVIIEKNLRVPNFKVLPLFLSLMLSLDPFIPTISGDRENSIKLMKEINANETTKLEDLDENQLNTLLYRLVSLIIKENPKFNRDDIVTDRIFYLDYDTLELSFSLIYSFDTFGSGEIAQFVTTPSYAEVLLDRFRSTLGKGFSLQLQNITKSYYIVNTNNFTSPLLTQLILLQLQKIKRDKTVVLKIGNNYYTSGYFEQSGRAEGLIKIDDRVKNENTV